MPFDDKKKPAIVIAAFGTSTKARITYDVFGGQLEKALPGHEIRWAFTSRTIRKRVNAEKEKQGAVERLHSLLEVLASLEADGVVNVVVQPLHLFPGFEYNKVLEIVRNFSGLRIEAGQTLFQRSDALREIVELLSNDFLTDEQGVNVLVAHGSPLTQAAANNTLLELNRYVSASYPNVLLGCIDGVVAKEEAMAKAKAHPGKKVRFIPLMYVAGDHVMNDIMGEDGRESWRDEAEAAGKTVDAPTVDVNGDKYFRGLGLLPEVNEAIIREIKRVLGRLGH